MCMIYTKTEKTRIEALLAAFHKFISTRNYFDIGYAEKTGYIHIYLDNNQEIVNCMAMRDFTEVLLVLFEEAADDVRIKRVRDGDESYCLYPSEAETMKSFLVPILDVLPNKEEQEYCKNKLDVFLKENLSESYGQ